MQTDRNDSHTFFPSRCVLLLLPILFFPFFRSRFRCEEKPASGGGFNLKKKTGGRVLEGLRKRPKPSSFSLSPSFLPFLLPRPQHPTPPPPKPEASHGVADRAWTERDWRDHANCHWLSVCQNPRQTLICKSSPSLPLPT